MTSTDLLSRFAGLRADRAAPGAARPAFLKTPYSPPITLGDQRTNDTLRPAGGEERYQPALGFCALV